MFLQYVYAQEVKWPDDTADFLSASEQLVLSAKYNMQK